MSCRCTVTWTGSRISHCRSCCWCGGQVGARVPGDFRGVGCLDNISHNWNPCSYTTSTADYCHAHGGHMSNPAGECDGRDIPPEPTLNDVHTVADPLCGLHQEWPTKPDDTARCETCRTRVIPPGRQGDGE